MRPIAHRLLAVLAAAAAFSAPAFAQERIVVTGASIADEIGEYVIPHVGVTRRADFLLRTVHVFNDTREAETREEELRATLSDMLRRAGRNDAIELSSIIAIDAGGGRRGDGDLIVVPFTDEHVEGGFRAGYGGRSDTSYVELVVKTPVGPDDTLAAAVARLESFVAGVERVGRSELDLQGADTLSVVDPDQYRDEIFAAMSADAAARLEALGAGYGARFEGLENPVEWYRADVLDVRLFIPHRFAILPGDE